MKMRFMSDYLRGFLLFAEFGDEVHLEGVGKARGGRKGDVDIAGEELGHVRTRNLEALRKRSLVEPKPLHLTNATPEKRTH